MLRTLPLLALITACDIELPTPRNCDERQAWYPDEDGDGVGEPGTVYVGCEPPEGWVDVLDTGDTGDSGYDGARRRAPSRGWRLHRRDTGGR